MAEPATAPALDFLEVELPEGFNDPIGEEFEIRPMVLPMGPSHPAMHGTVRIVLKLEGETVVDADVQVGYLHRGFEKECESGTWEQAIPYTDRLNYNSAIICNLGYCLAVEKLLGIEVPPRAQALRVLASRYPRRATGASRSSSATTTSSERRRPASGSSIATSRPRSAR